MEKEIKNHIVQLLQVKLSPSVIYLFGSTVKGSVRPDSDVDIAFVKSSSQVDKYELFLMAQELASQLNRDVDLIDLEHSSTVFQAQVVHTGEILYCRDENERAEFEMKVLKMYSKLNEERSPILNNVEKSGTVNNCHIILNNTSFIEQCIKRINEEYNQDPRNLENYTKQDSIVLNLQRACEASIDLAMHIVAAKKLGLPQNSRDAFKYLEEAAIIPADLSKKMKAMIGFRNIAVHDYQDINLEILQKILENHLSDFGQFTKTILTY